MTVDNEYSRRVDPLRRMRRCLVSLVVLSLCGLATVGYMRWRQLRSAVHVWDRFVEAVEKRDVEAVRMEIDQHTIRLNDAHVLESALVIDPSLMETRGTIMPLEGFHQFAKEHLPQPLTFEDFVSGRVRIGRSGSWGFGHFEVTGGKVRFVADP